jgi:DNA-binding NtrC family response regulator
MSERPLDGKRILIVEDEFLVALDLERIVGDIGAEIVGPLANLDQAVAAARAERLDGAILDVNIAGRTITPVAVALRERAIPFILSTGYGPQALDAELAGAPTLRKPFDEAEVKLLVVRTFAGG